MTGRDDVAAVAAVNASLYAAVESGDLDLMNATWLDGADADAVVCVHPGWSPLVGRTDVLRSWAAVMAGTPYIQFILTDVRIVVRGDVAVVSCTENILTGMDDPGSGEPTGFAGGRVAATNVLRRSSGGWRLWSHHSSPVLGDRDGDPFRRGEADDDEGDE